ncbi:MAG: hypothetical protein KJO88_09620 [Gammaproteobacteria bacterium]|nr:hypothetical protein [Gammaproteobacteria bacterium]
MIKLPISNNADLHRTQLSKDNSDSDVVIPMLDEYSLLIKNNQIFDYTNLKNSIGLDVRIGIYHDTHKFLTIGLESEMASQNIHSVLMQVQIAYQNLLTQTYGVNSTNELVDAGHAKKFARVQQLFQVDNIELFNGETFATLCLNLLIRPEGIPFILLGKVPKGKITREDRISKE